MKKETLSNQYIYDNLNTNYSNLYLNSYREEDYLISRKEIDFTLLDYKFILKFTCAYHGVIDIEDIYVQNHSCFSSQIEGSSLTLEQCSVLFSSEQYTAITSDEVMVLDCKSAISHIKKLLLAPLCEGKILSPSTVKSVHSALVTNDTKFKSMKYNKYIPGEFRTVQVYVGGCICPPPNMVGPYMDNFFYFLNNRPLSIETAFLAHLYIALIHPFIDGNGRSARLIEFYLLLKCGVPVEYASRMAEQYMKNREEYYYLLNESNYLEGNINFINFSFRLLDELINEEKPNINKTYFLLEEKK